MTSNPNEDGANAQAQAPGRPTTYSAKEFGSFAVLAIALIAGLQLFYGTFYSVHTDLAGAALSGRLAFTLGDAFSDYSLYFPPAERVWFSIAAFFSDLSGLRLDLTVILMTTLALLFSTGLAYHIRRQSVGASPLFLIVSIAVLVILPVLYKNVYGLREHLVVLGLWPYLVLRLSDPQASHFGWKMRALVGIWLGATLLMKYLYSLVVLLVELGDAAITSRPHSLFRVENLISGAMVALYLLFWLVLDPAQREAISAVVGAIDANLADGWISAQQAAIHASLAIFFTALGVIYKLPTRVTVYGIAMVVAAILASWIQARWYTHHLYPITMAYIAWLWMIHRDTRLVWLIGLAIVMGRPILGEYINSRIYQVTVVELDQAMEQSGISFDGKRVGVLTMHPSPFNQHLASHGAVRWNTSMNNSYVATLLKPLDRPENEGMISPPVNLDDPGVQLLHEELLHLWEDSPPDVLILDESTSWPLQFIDVKWQRAFADDARFNAILAGYQPAFDYEGEWLDFTVYLPADGSAQ